MVVDLLPDVDIVTIEFASSADPLEIDNLFVEDKDMRVFVINMYVDHAKRILCEVSTMS